MHTNEEWHQYLNLDLVSVSKFNTTNTGYHVAQNGEYVWKKYN